jgi:GR25 family glycosyltransferase involved in LPS biosynthesis
MFKKIYYINLEHRKDRREHVEKEIKKINFKGPVERVNAAYGKNLDLSLIPSNLFTKEAINSTTNKKDIANTKTMTKGGMGVALSQKWVYEKILCGEEDYALILEDDITIPNNFMTKLEETLKKVKYFDMLWLGYHIKYDLKTGDENGLDNPLKIYGLFGYIINKKAARKIIEIYPITQQIDSEIPQVFNDLIVYAVKKEDRIILSPTSEDSSQFGSDIQFNREAFENISNRNYCDNRLFIVISVCIIIMVFLLNKK